MKIIFLDINGVLDTYEEMDVVNQSNLLRLKYIVEQTRSSIVVSSSLKNSFYYTGRYNNLLLEIISLLEKNGINVIGITPNGENREEEIQMYLDLHPEITDFCIIDDDYDMNSFKNNIVKLPSQMDGGQGLDDFYMNMAIDILNNRKKRIKC